MRFGILGSTLFAGATTLTSTGAVNSMHDSYTALGGMLPMLNMMLGEVAPGGVGSGLYGMLILAVLAVFVGGLLVGRTPEYLGKRMGPREITLASLYILVTPTLVLTGTALSFAIPGGAGRHRGGVDLEPGRPRHERSALRLHLGSEQQRLGVRRPDREHPVAQHGSRGRDGARPLPPDRARSRARRVARRAGQASPSTAGTLPTHRPQFVGLLVGVTVIVTALTYFPVLALGPLAEGLV